MPRTLRSTGFPRTPDPVAAAAWTPAAIRSFNGMCGYLCYAILAPLGNAACSKRVLGFLDDLGNHRPFPLIDNRRFHLEFLPTFDFQGQILTNSALQPYDISRLELQQLVHGDAGAAENRRHLECRIAQATFQVD